MLPLLRQLRSDNPLRLYPVPGSILFLAVQQGTSCAEALSPHNIDVDMFIGAKSYSDAIIVGG